MKQFKSISAALMLGVFLSFLIFRGWSFNHLPANVALFVETVWAICAILGCIGVCVFVFTRDAFAIHYKEADMELPMDVYTHIRELCEYNYEQELKSYQECPKGLKTVHIFHNVHALATLLRYEDRPAYYDYGDEVLAGRDPDAVYTELGI